MKKSSKAKYFGVAAAALLAVAPIAAPIFTAAPAQATTNGNGSTVASADNTAKTITKPDTAAQYYVKDVAGTLTTNKDTVPTFNFATTTTQDGKTTVSNEATGKIWITEAGTTLTFDKVAYNQQYTYWNTYWKTGIYAYHVADTTANGRYAGQWVKKTGNDVTPTFYTNYFESATGTVVVKADKTTLYRNQALTSAYPSRAAAKGEDFNYTLVVKNTSDDAIVAYGRKDQAGNWEFIKAGDVTAAATYTTTVETLPRTHVYSNSAATIYSDQDATTDSGATLSTDVTEWVASRVSKDSAGNVVAYELGKNQWVKASDLQTTKSLDGIFVAGEGTQLYSKDGSKASKLAASGAYKVFAVTYMNGHQAVKLGSDAQWIYADAGDYYPAN